MVRCLKKMVNVVCRCGADRISVALVAGLLLVSQPAHWMPCQSPILNRVDIVKELSQKYHETQLGVHLLSPKAIAELFGNRWTETYTIVLTTVYDKSCVIASGTHKFQGES